MSLPPSPGTSVRKRTYKTGVDAEKVTSRREDNLMEIRRKKNKREHSLLKKLESLTDMVQGVRSDDPALQLEATKELRKFVSKGNPFVDDVMKTGVVHRFVEFLRRSDSPKLQYEAAWALANITAGSSENTEAVIECGAVPIFVQLLSSAGNDVREKAVGALGNIILDSTTCRDHVLSHGALIPLLSQFNENVNLSMLKTATWTLSNFFYSVPPMPFEQVTPALPVLHKLIHASDEEVVIDACGALSYLSDVNYDEIQAVIGADTCKRLVELLRHPSPEVLAPALEIIVNVAAGDAAMTQSVIDNGALACLHHLLTQSHEKIIRKNACQTVSNITAGTSAQIQAVIDANIFLPVVKLLQDAELDIKKEAAWVISNATSGGSHEQIQFVANPGCIMALCDLLICLDPIIVTVCLEGLENILKVGEADKKRGSSGGINIYAVLIDMCNGLDKIQNLQNHHSNEIRVEAAKISETYWVKE